MYIIDKDRYTCDNDKHVLFYIKKIKPHILTITKDVKVITFLRHSTNQSSLAVQ